MNETEEWDGWLVSEDSENPLTPDGFNYQAALARVTELRVRLTSALATHEVRTASPELYQDSTGLAHYRVTAKGDLRPFAPTLAWVLLSHFGELATIKGCQDSELLANIRGVLENFDLKYIPYEHVVNKLYNGRCKGLAGFSWANRYFSLTTDFNYEARDDG